MIDAWNEYSFYQKVTFNYYGLNNAGVMISGKKYNNLPMLLATSMGLYFKNMITLFIKKYF